MSDPPPRPGGRTSPASGGGKWRGVPRTSKPLFQQPAAQIAFRRALRIELHIELLAPQVSELLRRELERAADCGRGRVGGFERQDRRSGDALRTAMDGDRGRG